jgi:hypothetical protein
MKAHKLLAGAALAATLMPSAVALAAGAVVPPPMSVATARYYALHPELRAALLARLASRADASPRFTTSAGGTWTKVTKSGSDALSSPVLLTDGTVLAQSEDGPEWYKLTPDINGNYATGTWKQMASLPLIGGTQYAPLYHATAVLPDGRVIVMGGEYNGTSTEVWTNLGAIYNPVANSWTAVTAPAGSGWAQIGDAESVVLPNGTFMLASCCAGPTADALLDAATLTWTATGGPTAGDSYQDEQGYELLPSGNVLTIDIWTNYPSGGAKNAEQYVPASGTWISAGMTPESLPDPSACGNWEIGPAAMRGDGTLVAFGGNTGCVAGQTTDPTVILTTKTGKWKAGPNMPATCGSNSRASCSLADAPAAVLPTGNILVAASAGYGEAPTHFFEYSATNTIAQVSDPLANAASSSCYYYNFLVLPNGQVLMTDFTSTAEVYTPAGAVQTGWAPIITHVPTRLTPGTAYVVKGKQLGGLSQGAYYGDDAQMATNYPLVRIVNTATGHVFYAKTSGFSTMSIKPKIAGSATFEVPSGIETGASTLYVVANGIASLPVSVTVE